MDNDNSRKISNIILNGNLPSHNNHLLRTHFINLRETFMKNLELKLGESSLHSDLERCASEVEKLNVVRKYFEWIEVGAKGSPELKKSETVSDRFREVGNQSYKSRKYFDALRYYNLALMFGPIESREIVLAYSNLSALFMEMKEFEEATKSIELALKYLPKFGLNLSDLSSKLNQRMLKCHDISVNKPESKISIYDWNDNAPFSVNLKTPNPVLNSAENFVIVECDPKSGRKLIVTREVDTGETLLIEKPFSVTLDQELKWDTTHCHNCYNKILTGIPCNQCTFVIYCSDDCLKESQNSSHKYECNCFPYFYINSNSGAPFISERALLALRIVCKVGPDNIILQSQEINSDYSKICNLIKHEIQDEAYITKAFEGLLLVELLGYYTDFFKQDISIKYDVANLIVRHLECIPFNAISFSDLYKRENSDDLVSFPIATGIFPTISLINHSCTPNAIHIKHSKYLTTSVIAIRKLSPGEEICITYGPIYTRKNREERREELFNKYKFICQCQACSENWIKTQDSTTDRKGKLQHHCSNSKVKLQQIESELHAILESFHEQNFTKLTQSRKVLEKHLDYLTSNYEDNFYLIQVGQELLKKCFLYLVNFK